MLLPGAVLLRAYNGRAASAWLIGSAAERIGNVKHTVTAVDANQRLAAGATYTPLRAEHEVCFDATTRSPRPKVVSLSLHWR